MRRVTKKILTLLFGILFTGFYCEFLIYYVVIVQVLTALSFYACGSYQRGVGQNCSHSISQPSVSAALREVTMALNHISIRNKYIKFPQTQEERNKLKTEFYSAFGIPGVTGCIDGTHIALIRPAEYEERYFNRKRYHSINTQIICDASMYILSVDASHPGACHDAFIWNSHPVNRHLQNITEHHNETTWLLGVELRCSLSVSVDGYWLSQYATRYPLNVNFDYATTALRLLHFQRIRPTVLETRNSNELRALIIADTHLLGPRKGHWLDKWRREWQMHRGYQTIITLHRPDAVFLLGDVFDEGQWSSDKQFKDYVERFYRLFETPDEISLHIAAGNHDIGFHNYISRRKAERFKKEMNSSTVQFLTLKGNHFVLLNSMAMEGDSCALCTEARRRIENISKKLNCSQTSQACEDNIKKVKYSRPILMQHFPLYRKSDMPCIEPDAPPLPEKNKPFRIKIDALSKEATDYLASKIQPRLVFGGHTHHGCLMHHSYGDLEFEEHSVPSFSWRNRPDPKYMLVTITPDNYSVNKCGLPLETTIALSAVILLFTIIIYISKWRVLGR